MSLRTTRRLGVRLAGVLTLGLLIASCVHPTPVGTANEFFVDCRGGADGNPGTGPGQAWRSLRPVDQHAFVPGDQIHLARGCDWDAGLVLTHSGTADQPIVISAFGSGDSPVITNSAGGQWTTGMDIRASHVVIDGLTVRDVAYAGLEVEDGANHNVIRNVQVRGAGLGVVLRGSDNIVTSTQVHSLHMVVNTPKTVRADDDYGAVGYVIMGPRNEVSFSTCDGCRAPSYDYGYDGGFAEIFDDGDGTFLHHNFAVDAEGFLEIGSRARPRSARGVRISRNVVFNSGVAVCAHTSDQFAVDFDGLRFENNTVVQTNPVNGRVFDCMKKLDGHDVLVRNNIFVLTGGGMSSAPEILDHSFNLYFPRGGADIGYALAPTEKIADPQFVDLNGDFRLRPGSPAIDAGTDLGPDVDIDGHRVPSGAAPDIGAYEHAEE